MCVFTLNGWEFREGKFLLFEIKGRYFVDGIVVLPFSLRFDDIYFILGEEHERNRLIYFDFS